MMADANAPPQQEPFHMEVDEQGTAVVVRLSGSITMEICEDLQTQLVDLASQPTPQLIVDLSAVSFICSLGLGALVAAHLQSRQHHGTVKLVCPPPRVMDLLEVTKLTRLFPPFASIENAMAAG